MKYFIAFLLLFFAPNFASNAAFATINSTQIGAHSTILPQKKLSFKEKLFLKFDKKDVEKMSKAKRRLMIGILLVILGAILLFVGNEKSKAAPQNAYVPSFAGSGETILGVISAAIGLIMIINNAGKESLKKAPPATQMP